MIKDFKPPIGEPCGYVGKDENGNMIVYDLDMNVLVNYAEVKNKQIDVLYKEIMTLDELESASMLYDSHKYNSFFRKI